MGFAQENWIFNEPVSAPVNSYGTTNPLTTNYNNGISTDSAYTGKVDTTVYTINDIDAFPEFYDSDKQIWQYVSDKVKYTESIGSDVKGQMVLSFIVNTDGSLSNLKLRRGLSPALDEQVLQIVKDLPKLRPAKKNGNPVRCELIIAVYLSNE